MDKLNEKELKTGIFYMYNDLKRKRLGSKHYSRRHLLDLSIFLKGGKDVGVPPKLCAQGKKRKSRSETSKVSPVRGRQWYGKKVTHLYRLPGPQKNPCKVRVPSVSK